MGELLFLSKESNVVGNMLITLGVSGENFV